MGGVIVCVDDRRDLLAALIRDLSELDDEFELLACESGTEALQALGEASSDAQVRLVITSGRQSGTVAGQSCDQLDLAPRLIITGDLSSQCLGSEPLVLRQDERLHGILPKPWSQRGLLETVRAMLS